jgi:hypothetical protein
MTSPMRKDTTPAYKYRRFGDVTRDRRKYSTNDMAYTKPDAISCTTAKGQQTTMEPMHGASLLLQQGNHVQRGNHVQPQPLPS